MLVDSHCHLHLLDLPPTHEHLAPILQRAKANGVEHMLCVATALEEYAVLTELAARYSQLSLSIGIHPTHAPAQVFSQQQLLSLARHPKVVAIGETGLDYFRSNEALTCQQARFAMHIEVAQHCQKPLIIHSRAAKQDTLHFLNQAYHANVNGVMHCFTEDWAMAKQAIDKGFLISFSGIVTFKNATTVQEVARKIPLSQMLVETDSPYLAPVPWRGKPNEPAYVRLVAQSIAQLRNESLDNIIAQTGQNFLRLFFQGAPLPV
jgi:TatD DNase family protein